jgi:hypothetical protein
MTDPSAAETSHADVGDLNGPGLFKNSFATGVLFFRLVAAGAKGIEQCLTEMRAATQDSVVVDAESSTQLRAPAIEGALAALLADAREDLMEDGMNNTVNERLPPLLLMHPQSIIRALAGLIEAGQTPPIIAAQLLKELGRARIAASHSQRRWVLERALCSPSPVTRDGAGLGLARLGDHRSLRYLVRAVEIEADPELRTDLQRVVDELTEATWDGSSV